MWIWNPGVNEEVLDGRLYIGVLIFPGAMSTLKNVGISLWWLSVTFLDIVTLFLTTIISLTYEKKCMINADPSVT